MIIIGKSFLEAADMEDRKKKVALNDELLDKVTGGYADDDLFGDDANPNGQEDNEDIIPVDEILRRLS